jgi:hypothetical protein
MSFKCYFHLNGSPSFTNCLPLWRQTQYLLVSLLFSKRSYRTLDAWYYLMAPYNRTVFTDLKQRTVLYNVFPCWCSFFLSRELSSWHRAFFTMSEQLYPQGALNISGILNHHIENISIRFVQPNVHYKNFTNLYRGIRVCCFVDSLWLLLQSHFNTLTISLIISVRFLRRTTCFGQMRPSSGSI